MPERIVQMLKTRVASAIVIVLVTLVALLSGGPILLGILALISVIGYFELCRALKVHEEGKKYNALEVPVYGMILIYFGTLFVIGDVKVLLPCIVATLILLLLVYVFLFPKFHADQVMKSLFGYIYAPIMLSFIYLIRILPNGHYIVWMVFICSWVCDTCAYAVGMLFGKHKMAPVLSPKKSVEGGIGGIVGSAFVGAAFGMLMEMKVVDDPNVIWVMAVVGAVGAVISQVGDLSASAIKRNYEIKDYGTLIPGHGGILDRFDSVIITAPIVYFLASCLLG